MKILFIVMGILSLFSSCSGKKEKQQEKEKLYSWYPSESAPYLYPTTIHVGYFGMPDKSTVYIPSKSLVGNVWGVVCRTFFIFVRKVIHLKKITAKSADSITLSA